MIRIKPDEGQHIIISKTWFDSNQFFTQYMQNMKPAKVYEILRVDELDDWGIAAIRDIETDEVFDISHFDELDEYFCIFNKYDDIRIVTIN